MNRLFASYLLLSGLALVGPHRPTAWPLLALLHGALAWWGFRARPRVDSRAALRWLGDAYPLIVMPLLYAELPLLNRALFAGRYFDPLVIGWERALFGFEPARDFATLLPYGWLSESLLAAYVSYYLIIYVPPLAIAWKHGHAALREAVFTLSLVFFAHYLFFVWFPVEGPRYRFGSPVPADARGPVYALAHALLEAGSSRGAAFPS
ncbi:MAG TPA: phosphatase PAP2 family protein, partial [Thermoanaerobaculia bacterium]